MDDSRHSGAVAKDVLTLSVDRFDLATTRLDHDVIFQSQPGEIRVAIFHPRIEDGDTHALTSSTNEGVTRLFRGYPGFCGSSGIQSGVMKS